MSAQTIYRVAYRNLPFSQIGNDMLRDSRLSIEARGALAMILTYPADWQFNLKWLCKMARVGRDQGRRIVKELEKHGYCQRRRSRKSDGTLGSYEHIFTDQSGTFAMPAPEIQAVGGGLPVTGFQSPYKERHKKKGATLFKKLALPGSGLRDHSETFEEYRARMIREGKLPQ